MRTIPRLLVALVVVTTLLMVIGTPARAAETILYDVTTSTFIFGLAPVLATTSERIQITDRGPQTDGSPRWSTESLGQVFVWDEAGGGSPELFLFGNTCANISMDPLGPPLSRVVQVTRGDGGGDFAWLPGLSPPDGATDPYAFFCLKWSHQGMSAWSEQVSIGRRVYAALPPPSPLKVFITEPKAGATVNGTVWVVIWVEGTSGVSNIFTLSADGQQVGSQTTSSSGPVRIRWKPVGTTSVPNGTHTLTGTVRDAAGNTGTTSITVILKN